MAEERVESGSTQQPEGPKRTAAPAGARAPTYAPGERSEEARVEVPGIVNIPITPLNFYISRDQLERLSVGFLVLGVAMVTLGTVAILAPLCFSLVVEQLVGVLLVIAGVVTLVQGLQLCGVSAPACTASLLMAALDLTVGVWLLVSPVEGLVGLVLLLASWFFASGLVKIVMAYQLRYLTTWPGVLVSGLLSIVLAVLILAQWPSNAGWVIGLLVGIDLTFKGTSLLLVACMASLGQRVEVQQPLLG